MFRSGSAKTYAGAMAFILTCAATALAPPALAQGAAEREEGFSLFEEGAKKLLEGFLRDMEPALSEADRAFRKLAPQIEELMQLVRDFDNYDMPVMLDNGDILIRRKAPLPPGSPRGTLPFTRPEGLRPETPPPAPAPVPPPAPRAPEPRFPFWGEGAIDL